MNWRFNRCEGNYHFLRMKMWKSLLRRSEITGSGKQYASGSTCPSAMERVEDDQAESTILCSGLECYCRKFMVIARLNTTSHENTQSCKCSQVAPTAGGDIFMIASVALIKGLRGTSFALSEFLVVKKFLEKM